MADTVNQQDDEPIAGDLIGADFFPTSKITIGADGVDDGFVSDANPFPVAIISGAGSGGTAQDDGVAFAPNMAGTPAQGVYESTPSTVTDGDIAIVGITSSRALRVDGSGATQPVSAASLPLPSGAATEAKQDTGNTSLASAVTALQVIDNIVQVDDADFTDNTTPGVPVMGVYESSPTTVTDGDLGVVGITVNRELKVAIEGAPTIICNAGTDLNTSLLALESGGNLAACATSLATLDNAISGSEMQVDVLTVPADPFGANADAASATGSISAKLRFIASTGIPITGTVTVGSHAVTNAGTFVVQIDGSALASLQLLDDAVATTGSAITAKGFTACGTDGINARALKTDSSGELQVDVLSVPALAAGTNTIGGVTPVAATSGGATPYRKISTADANATNVKASAGTVYGIQVFNMNASVRYLKLYDSASAPTAGSGTPVKVIAIPGATTGAGAILNCPVGINFASGIGFTLVTGSADSDSTGVAASEIHVNIDYK